MAVTKFGVPIGIVFVYHSVMSLNPYQKPNISGITMASGSFTQQAIYDGVLTYEAPAKSYADAIGAKLVNALDTPATNFTLKGIEPSSDPAIAQPWMVTWDNISFYFAGIAINQQITATKALTGVASADYPGTWAREASGVWDFTPQPIAPVATPPVAPNPADAAAWATIMGVGTLSEAQKDQLLVAIAVAVGAKVPA